MKVKLAQHRHRGGALEYHQPDDERDIADFLRKALPSLGRHKKMSRGQAGKVGNLNWNVKYELIIFKKNNQNKYEDINQTMYWV